jgi:hypothetical protein
MHLINYQLYQVHYFLILLLIYHSHLIKKNQLLMKIHIYDHQLYD